MTVAQNLETNQAAPTLAASLSALDEIDRLAGDDEHLQNLGRELGLTEFKEYLTKIGVK